MFKGIYTALITPFKYGEVDVEAYEKMIEWQIESGIRGLVIGGSTGEGQNLSKEEFLSLVETAVRLSKGRINIIANTGLNSTFDSIELSQAAQELNIDGIMLVSPYYVKPTQEGLYQHFKAIHDLTSLPIIIYNHPGRTGVDISNETISRLAELPRIKALKDSTGNPIRCIQIHQQAEIDIMVGDDTFALPYYSQGATGLISMGANIVPSLMVQLHDLWDNNHLKEALELQNILYPLNESLNCETNPVPIKYAASQFSLCSSDVRLPLVPLSERSKKLIRETLQTLKIRLYEQPQ